MWLTDFIAANGRRPEIFVQLACMVDTVSYRPVDETPGAKAGDLAVIIMRHDGITVSSSWFLSEPSGWSTLRRPSANSNQTRFPQSLQHVYYKVLQPADLTTTFSWVHRQAPSTGYDLCGSVFIIPANQYNVDIPFDFGSSQVGYTNGASGSSSHPMFGGSVGSIWAPPESVLLWMIDSSTNTTISDQEGLLVATLGRDLRYPDEPILLERSLVMNQPGFSGARISTYAMYKPSRVIANLLPGESFRDPLTNWTGVGLSTFNKGLTAVNRGTAKATVYARMVANTIPGEHYAYYDVSLTAGKRYTLNIGAIGGSSVTRYPGLAVVPPSGTANEFGFVSGGGTMFSTNDYTNDPFSDPQGGRNSWWWGGTWYTFPDGIPNAPICLLSIVFTAQETGVHRLKINSSNGLNWANRVHSTATEIQVSSAAFIEGTAIGHWNRSDFPVGRNFFRESPFTYNSAMPGANCIEGVSVADVVVINPPGALPKGVLTTFDQNTRCEIFPDLDYYGPGSCQANDSQGSPVTYSRMVYPSINGVRQKYYAEMTVMSTGTSTTRHYIGASPLLSSVQLDNSNDVNMAPLADGYFWVEAGRASAPLQGLWNAAVGDVLGVMVDYVNNVVSFYKNGVLDNSLTMQTSNGRTHPNEPFVFFAALGTAYGISPLEASFNFTGPFSYPPAGSIAWDWKAGAGSGLDVAMRVTGSVTVAVTSTVVSPTIPATVLPGDLLVALVMARSALTPPAGWDFVESETVDNGAGTVQTLYVYTRTAQVGDAGTAPTWTQSVSGRMNAAYHVYRSTQGSTLSVLATATLVQLNGNNGVIFAPALAPSAAGQSMFLATSCVNAQTTPTATSFTTTYGAIAGTSSLDQLRIYASTKVVTSVSGDALTGIENHDTNISGDTDAVAIALVIGA